MEESDDNIFSISRGDRGFGMTSARQPCPPAVVITHDSDNYLSASINPSSGEGLLTYKGLGASTLSLAAGANGGPPSRAGSPRHSKVHPSEGSSLPKSGSSMAVFSTEGQLLENVENPPSSGGGGRCCSGRARGTALGLLVTATVCGAWVGLTHLLKWATSGPLFRAPFFTTWLFTACHGLFFPAYLLSRCCSSRTRTTARGSILESMRRFREKGLTALHFLTRSIFFCLLWVGTNYMLIYAIAKLDATIVMALQASNASFTYLLSWVILHEQFVGIRIVAVIMCNTGIALLAYMDGVSRTSTLGGVVLAAAAAAGLAVHKVLFKKLIGRVTMGQLSIFLTLVSLLNILLLWPIGLTLYLVQTEVIAWSQLPYVPLAGACALFILINVLANFDIVRNYDIFLKLGLVAAVPVSAVLDVHMHQVVFEGMKLAGILLISIGFMLVLLPDNWPDYITRLIRWRCRKCSKSSKPTDTSQPKSR